MDNQKAIELKQEAIELLRKRLAGKEQRLREVDERLWEYFNDCATRVSTEFGDPNDQHSMWELLCAAKFLRMLDTYDFNAKRVRFFMALREGKWERQGKAWRYVSGGLKLPATIGAKVYRWQPFQVFVLSTVFGFYTWFNTEVEAGTKYDMLPTEQERDDGWIWDFRRMVSEFIMYGPRKIDKTGLSAFIQLVFFMFMDFNSEIYSLGMAEYQSKILYDRTKFMLRQLSDAGGNQRFRMTEKQTNWAARYQKDQHNSKIVPLTAGGKAPDGTNTELLNWDELGSSPYTNGKSDMQNHINVCQSSMGQRRQPLTFGTTTAGTITSGPFIEKLETIHNYLLMELEYEKGTATPTLSGDRQMCLLLEPDEYEKSNEQYILTSHALRRKINPMLGIVVQTQFYEDEMEKARNEGNQKLAECISKLFNVYQSDLVEPWKVTADKVRRLQVPMRIGDCRWDLGWRVFVGLDFGGMDDLWASSFFAVNYADGLEMKDRFFADCEAWVVEADLQKSPNRPLYEQWISEGWLHVCPGDVFDSNLAVNDIIRKAYPFSNPDGTPDYRQPMLDYRMFSYDPAQSRDPINQLKAWLQSLFQAQGLGQRDIVERIKSMVVPCSQSFMTMNPIITQLETYVLTPWLRFSNSPLWPWQAGNAMMVTSRDDTLKKIIKSKPQNKVDNLHALLDAIYGYELSEGNISQE